MLGMIINLLSSAFSLFIFLILTISVLLSAALIHNVINQSTVRTVKQSEFVSEFNDKLCIVTGASSGIGQSIAIKLASAGAKLVLIARSADGLNDTKQQCLMARKNAGFDANNQYIQILKCDLETLANDEQLAASVINDALKLHSNQSNNQSSNEPKLHLLVSNAGVSVRGSVASTKQGVHRSLMDVNYFGAVCLITAALPHLLASHGALLCVSSVQGLFSIPHRSAYAASKHAVAAFVETLRSELPVGSGVKITLCSLGYVATNLSVNALAADGSKHGKLDETTAKGMKPSYVATKCLSALIEGKPRFILADAKTKVAVWMRAFAPTLLDHIMVKRAEKERAEE